MNPISSMSSEKPHVLLMGQTPPPWHGQAVATQILFEHDWPGFEIHRLRMEFSEEMLEVGRFQWKKIRHLLHLIRKARAVLNAHPGCILFYPPASAKWIPFLRDVIFLASVRPLAGSSVFIYHASGLPAFVGDGALRQMLGKIAYHGADVSLEVAQETIPPHEVFEARSWQWCPCAIDVPELPRQSRKPGEPLRVLFVGSLQEGKGVLEVLKTAGALKRRGLERDFRFRIVGKWFSEEFEVAARVLWNDLKLGSMVEFTGQLTGDDKWNAYRDADVFFFPTHYASEATPIVLMEALGAGLPIISTEWAGIPAMMNGCVAATLLPVRSPEAYADALKELHEDTGAGERNYEAARAFHHAHFKPERFVERVGKSFLTALEPSPATHKTHLAETSTTETGDHADLTKPGESPALRVVAYLADQNPGHDRSFGISRMSQVVLEALHDHGDVVVDAIVSRSSQQAPSAIENVYTLPWGTRRKWVRLITDHFHPLFNRGTISPNLHYFPKGYLPLLSVYCKPSVVTIHDTIIQYDEDHYPEWRNAWEYRYWAMMLKHTLHRADRVLTVSESAKRQILDFMARHRIPRKPITVTYESCPYEHIPQPGTIRKENYVIHLASCEPHKRTAHLVRWWSEAEAAGKSLPMLHLIGAVPPEVQTLLARSRTISKRPFLEDDALQAAYMGARALILPSEIEGFGLPALESYYLGTPVCFVKGTSVEEVLGVATHKGGFTLDSSESLFTALDEIMSMPPDEVRACGLTLRETYASAKVVKRMVEVFHEVSKAWNNSPNHP